MNTNLIHKWLRDPKFAPDLKVVEEQTAPEPCFLQVEIVDRPVASMEHSLFSLSTKPDMRYLEYRQGDNVLKIRPSPLGLPTIFDKDVLIFVISQLMARKNKGQEIGDTVVFNHTQTERKSEIQPHRIRDHIRREAIAAINRRAIGTN